MWCGVVWCGVVWCGVVWCGVVWCGVVWCGVVWCGVVWYGMVWHGMAWHGMAWYGFSNTERKHFHTCFVQDPVLCYKQFLFLFPTVHEVPRSAVNIVCQHVHLFPEGQP